MKLDFGPDITAMEHHIRNQARTVLPDSNQLISDARQAVAGIEIGLSAFLARYGCTSELEYKRQCMQEKRIMYHAHIGLNDIDATAQALQHIHRQLDMQGFRLDRAGFALDRRMGLPSAMRSSVAAETGPMLAGREDWTTLAQAVPVQPHLGDFMIGQPASFENTVQALRIGCTTVGNLSQFFTFEAPGWNDRVATSAATVKAIALLAAFRKRGAMLHSYLEDGYGALFQHCATVAAWAMLERYIVEELLGARLTHCIGGLTSDPIKRSGWVMALQQIHQGDLVGSMIYGDTISFGTDFNKNRAITAEYLLWDILTQMHTPSGHALLPLPVTEAIRVPSADEILEAQCFGREVEQTAGRLFKYVDFSAARAFADDTIRDGNTIYQNALSGLHGCGVDVRNPVQMLFVLKQIGPETFETLFGNRVNNSNGDVVTDMYQLSQRAIAEYRPLFASTEMRQRMQGKRLLLASSDVHQHAIGALAQLLSEAGADVINLGAEQSPQNLIDHLLNEHVDALLLSTHNGMALDYARQIRMAMDSHSLRLPVVMGGVLNQKVESQALPVPVLEQLKSLGFYPAIALPHLPALLQNNT